MEVSTLEMCTLCEWIFNRQMCSWWTTRRARPEMALDVAMELFDVDLIAPLRVVFIRKCFWISLINGFCGVNVRFAELDLEFMF